MCPRVSEGSESLSEMKGEAPRVWGKGREEGIWGGEREAPQDVFVRRERDDVTHCGMFRVAQGPESEDS
jgi:hypothetical protein